MPWNRVWQGQAAAQTRELLAHTPALTVVDKALVPALDQVGAKYEAGTLFLPQLLQAASAAQSAFAQIREALASSGGSQAGKGKIVLATVQGDVHDIGKNIVHVLLENYGFEVIDLGRDVPVQQVVDTVRRTGARLVGLSALMTTTLPSMEKTIAALRTAGLDCKVMVGGAVLTPEYAAAIGADWYAKDAKRSADIAKEFFGVGYVRSRRNTKQQSKDRSPGGEGAAAPISARGPYLPICSKSSQRNSIFVRYNKAIAREVRQKPKPPPEKASTIAGRREVQPV